MMAGRIAAIVLFSAAVSTGATAQSLFEQAQRDNARCADDLFALAEGRCDEPASPAAADPAEGTEPDAPEVLPPTPAHAPILMTSNDWHQRLRLRRRGKERGGVRPVAQHRFPDSVRRVFRAPAEPGDYEIVDITKGRELVARVKVTPSDAKIAAPAVIEPCAPTFPVRIRGPRWHGDGIDVSTQDGDVFASFTFLDDGGSNTLHLPVPEAAGAYRVSYKSGGHSLAATTFTRPACTVPAAPAEPPLPDFEALKSGGPAAPPEGLTFDPANGETPRLEVADRTVPICGPIEITWHGPATPRTPTRSLGWPETVRRVTLALPWRETPDMLDWQELYSGFHTVTLFAPARPGPVEIRYIAIDKRGAEASILVAVPITVTPGDPAACAAVAGAKRARAAGTTQWITENGGRPQ
ncbi:hypothetical protein RDV64_03490 [Acuticoccus sp. MNP-M23]|uniref:hypothetical protein n=1 Tax=Acuticoccus sp. MNP-M23 TaxID=3072793 RepID=UPI0028162283|nr:hypothetical protein [Acuticoccus sp. MNP-M23]WMS43475.1 hypothetical protein RDV64_03490 [Acuticoccus sp. MNP-M23]